MKTNYWLLLGVLIAGNAIAQNSTNSLPPIPVPANVTPTVTAPVATVAAPTNAPAKKTVIKHKKKKAAKLAAKTESAPAAKPVVYSEATITLVPGPATVAVDNLNVRGQAGLKGEVVAHLKKDEAVTVLSQINLDKHKADEPSQWAKIALPAGADVWVRSSFIDAKDKTVLPKKLNLRAGPSEDYSVLGVLDHGATVTEAGAKGEWTKIEAPTNAFAFIAAEYLKQEASGNAPTNFGPSTEVPVAPETNTIPATLMTVTEPPPIVNQPLETADTNSAPSTNSTLLPPPIGSDTNTTVLPDTNTTTVIEDTNPPPPRIVTHEGYVRSSVSLVAPTYFELYDPTTDEAINYLYSTTTNLNLARYNGFKIVVTGEEGLDARWKDTPVLTVQKIYVVSTNVPATQVITSPRASTTH